MTEWESRPPVLNAGKGAPVPSRRAAGVASDSRLGLSDRPDSRVGVFGFIAAPCSRCYGDAYPAWRGAFCGLARCLGREFGDPARLLVNRDAAFMGLLGISLDPQPPTWKQGTCCNPCARPFGMADAHPAVLHAAAVSVCGLAVKLADDSRDEGPLRRGVARIGRQLAGPATDRAIARLNSSSFPTAPVMACLDGQDAMESADPLRADEPTAAAYGWIVSHLAVLLGLPGSREPLERTGRALGSLVYWRDAWTDRRDDARCGRFNPFESADQADIRRRIVAAWEDLGAALGTLPWQRHAALVGGVLQTTGRERASFLELRPESPEERAEKKRRKKERTTGRRWHDCCDCCDCCTCCTNSGSGGRSKGGCCDAACDCGPGDKGCCDCNPCDGCDCCP